MTTIGTPKETGSQAGEVSAERRAPDWLNVPNLLTLSRLVLAVVLFWMIWYDGLWKTAAVVFAVAAATDFLDGYIARRYGLVTPLGRILDPFADKIIICGSFVFLMQHVGSGIYAWMVTVILAREMFITSLRGYLEQQGRDFSAAWAGKLKMGLQCAAVPMCLLSLSEELKGIEWFALARNITIYAAIIVTVYSGIEYSVRATRMLKSTDD